MKARRFVTARRFIETRKLVNHQMVNNPTVKTQVIYLREVSAPVLYQVNLACQACQNDNAYSKV